MSKIKIMSENLANKIAAGEVIEKCSSIVKELVENSIDAQSSEINIDLKNGGLLEIKITDNGIGMDENDALLAFQRHATSKLLKDDDLFFINTLGFRGEALPSIASVSEVTLKTCNSNIGTTIHIKGGKLLENNISDARRGTTITVKNLFYNTPARYKYLKSEQYELANSVSLIEKIALSYPNIKFTLTNNEKTIIKTSGSNNLLKTIHEIYGLQVSSNMIEVKASNNDYDISGFICKPEILKSNRNFFITIINGRVVKNNELNRAINDAYYTYKPDNKFPIVILKIETDPTLIDVNIHPTKQDIKMSKTNDLFVLINDMIKNALYKTLLIPTINAESLLNEEKNDFIQEKTIKYEEKNTQEELSFINEPKEEYQELFTKDNVINDEIKKLELNPIALVMGTYIIAEGNDCMYLIDQHAAHERINYERVLKSCKEHQLFTIPLLIPITIELSPSDFITLKQHQNILEDIGFKIEEFGINTILVKEQPTWLKEGYEEEIVRRVIDYIVNNPELFNIDRFNDTVMATIACKMSVKGNTRITFDDMKELLNELVKTNNPYNCPHGRPTMIKFTQYELEKMFKRVMN